MAEVYDFDYLIIFDHLPKTRQIKLLCSWGLERGGYPNNSWGENWEETEPDLAKIFERPEPFSGFFSMDDFVKLNFIEPLRKFYGQRPESKVWGLFFHHVGYYDLAIIVGKKGKTFDKHQFLSFDYASLQDMIWEIPKLYEAGHLLNQVMENAHREAQILSEIAHDIRNPITSIVIKTQKLRGKSGISEEVKGELKDLSSMVQRLHQMSERVWIIQDLQNHRISPSKDNIKLNEVIHSCIKSFQEQADERSLSFMIAKTSEQDRAPYFFHDWPNLILDSQLVYSVFSNLIDNTIKYSKPGSQIRIDGKRTSFEQRISIVNVGLKLLPNELDKIFERGYRSTTAKVSVQQGSGLGLHLVRTIMNIYGTISLKVTDYDNANFDVFEFILTFKED